MSHDRMESSFNVMMFPVDQFAMYSVITINNDENITVSVASRIFYTPNVAGTEFFVSITFSLALFMYVCVFVFLVL
jgi:hypothetical protein